MRFEFRCSTTGGCGQTIERELPSPSEAWVFERAKTCGCGGRFIRLKHPQERYVGGGIEWVDIDA